MLNIVWVKKMKIFFKIFFLSVILIFCIALGYLLFYEPKYSGEILYEETLLFGHRGFGYSAPENSLDSIQKAVEFGLDGIEIDVQLTKDNELIVFHDSFLDRLTNGTGEVSEKTLEEIKFLSYYGNESVLTLDEVLNQVNGKLVVDLDVKCGRANCNNIEVELVRVIENHEARSYVYVDSFNPLLLYRVKKLDPDVKTIFAFRDVEPLDSTNTLEIPFFLKYEPFRRVIRKIIEPDLLSVEITVNKKTIERLASKGYPLVLWTAKTDEEIVSALNKKPFAVITEDPIKSLEIKRDLKYG